MLKSPTSKSKKAVSPQSKKLSPRNVSKSKVGNKKNATDFQVNDPKKTANLFKNNSKTALIIIDVQNDFCYGPMAGDEGSTECQAMIQIVNKLRDKPVFDHVFKTRDWHPKDHISFQSNNPGAELFDNFLIPNLGIH